VIIVELIPRLVDVNLDTVVTTAMVSILLCGSGLLELLTELRSLTGGDACEEEYSGPYITTAVSDFCPFQSHRQDLSMHTRKSSR
jgi:hypothetical protein